MKKLMLAVVLSVLSFGSFAAQMSQADQNFIEDSIYCVMLGNVTASLGGSATFAGLNLFKTMNNDLPMNNYLGVLEKKYGALTVKNVASNGSTKAMGIPTQKLMYNYDVYINECNKAIPSMRQYAEQGIANYKAGR